MADKKKKVVKKKPTAKKSNIKKSDIKKSGVSQTVNVYVSKRGGVVKGKPAKPTSFSPFSYPLNQPITQPIIQPVVPPVAPPVAPPVKYHTLGDMPINFLDNLDSVSQYGEQTVPLKSSVSKQSKSAIGTYITPSEPSVVSQKAPSVVSVGEQSIPFGVEPGMVAQETPIEERVQKRGGRPSGSGDPEKERLVNWYANIARLGTEKTAKKMSKVQLIERERKYNEGFAREMHIRYAKKREPNQPDIRDYTTEI